MQNIEKTTTYLPIVVILPSILGPILCGEEKTSWELHRIVKSWVDPKDMEVKLLFRAIIDWLIWSCVKGINEDTSAAKTDMNVVTLPSQKLKSYQKLRLEGSIWKVAGITEVGITPDKSRISSGSSGVIVSVTSRKLFCAR